MAETTPQGPERRATGPSESGSGRPSDMPKGRRGRGRRGGGSGQGDGRRVEIPIPRKRYRYTGMERDDETGLQYHHHRYYAPWIGRWTRPDPAGLRDGVNRFAYVGGSPAGSVDPAGLGEEKSGESVHHNDRANPWDAQSKKREEAEALKEAVKSFESEFIGSASAGGRVFVKPGVIALEIEAEGAGEYTQMFDPATAPDAPEELLARDPELSWLRGRLGEHPQADAVTTYSRERDSGFRVVPIEGEDQAEPRFRVTLGRQFVTFYSTTLKEARSAEKNQTVRTLQGHEGDHHEIMEIASRPETLVRWLTGDLSYSDFREGDGRAIKGPTAGALRSAAGSEGKAIALMRSYFEAVGKVQGVLVHGRTTR